jgi:hypothetical protein
VEAVSPPELLPMLVRLLAPLVVVALASHPRLVAADVSFEREVVAVLARAGCSAGACHGNLNGKGGFKLSLRGEDPAVDYQVLTRDMLARRVDRLNPAQSLLLLKATGQVPHEGGTRFASASPEAAIVRAWMAAGCPADPPQLPKLSRLDVAPTQQVLVDPTDRFRVTVTAHFADGTRRDVTALASFEFTTLGIARISSTGEVQRDRLGETVLIVRYLSQVAAVPIVFLPNRPVPDLADYPTAHAIDRLVAAHWRHRRLPPADLAPDSVFVRRAYLDALGVLPTPDETRAFLADPDPHKREKLIDQLLTRPEFAEFWAQKWSDVLRNEEKALDRKGVTVFYRWLAAQIAADRPLQELAREILTATGSTYAHPPANFWRAVRDPLQRAESVAQVFLGIRIGCARCHNHPFDRWTMDDYYGFAAVFARLDYRILENKRRDDLDKHEFVGEQIVFQNRTGEVLHPRTGRPVAPRMLGGPVVSSAAGSDRLALFADWLTTADNPYFAAAQVNRIWLHLMGRGLVDPNDDFRLTNPPTNPELLDWLTRDFVAGGYRLKRTVRHIMTSRVYQLASTSPPSHPATDDGHHARAAVLPLQAEQLLDALAQVTQVPVPFKGYPLGLRANQIPAPPQSGRRGFDGVGERFLQAFGKPERLLTCECERNTDPGLLQAFQLTTGELIHSMIRHRENRIGKHLAAGLSDAAILEDLYLAALCRPPTPTEADRLLAFVRSAPDRRAAWEDVLWAVLNSKEFLLRR